MHAAAFDSLGFQPTYGCGNFSQLKNEAMSASGFSTRLFRTCSECPVPALA